MNHTIRTKYPMLLVVTSLVGGCGGIVGETSATNSATQSRDFSVTCTLATTNHTACASAICTTQSIGGLEEALDVSIDAIPGLTVLGAPTTTGVGPIGSEFELSYVATGPVQASSRITLTDGLGRQHSSLVELDMPGIPIPPSAGDDMVFYGCATTFAETFQPVFVGAWATNFRGAFCVQSIGNADGTYLLTVPVSCFGAGSQVFLTAGGEDGCARPFAAGAVTRLDLVGSATPACLE